jgi:aminopeptidase YwaD
MRVHGMRRSRGVVVAVAVLAWSLARLAPVIVAQPQSSCLLAGTDSAAILDELSGIRAKDSVIRLTGFTRTPASSGFHDAVEFLQESLRQAGVPDVHVESYGTDAPQPWSVRRRPGLPSWEVRRAELRSMDPPRRIASFEEEPICLARYSRPGHVVADLVDVGVGVSPADYVNKDVRGKLVLATGYANRVDELAVGGFGAAGVIVSGGSSYSPRTGWGYPDMVNWQVLNPRASGGREPSFAFVISQDEGEWLREQLRGRRTLRLEADVDATLADAPQEVLTAAIPGTSHPDEQVLLLGHLDHVRPSANDNASGSSALLEVARSLQRLIRSGRLVRPARTIRFLWMTEGAGTVGYLNAHPDVGGHTVAALNLDMVGEYLVPGTGPMRLTRTPDSLPSFLVDTVMNMVQHVDTRVVFDPTGSDSLLNIRLAPFSANSDHYTLADGAIGIPAMLLHHAPDPFHHANIDGPDKVDPTEMHRSMFIAAATAYYLARVGPEQLPRLAAEVYGGASMRLGETAREALSLMDGVPVPERDEAYGFADRKLTHVADRELGALASISRLAPEHLPDLKPLASGLTAQATAHRAALASRYVTLTGRRPPLRVLSSGDARAERLVPRKKVRFINERWQQELQVDALTASEREWLTQYMTGTELPQVYIRVPEMLNFVDGRRTLLDIRDRVSSEFFDWSVGDDYAGHYEDMSLAARRIGIDSVLELMRLLEKGELIVLEERK